MDNRPIGIFDSGLGGLTAAMAVRKIFPGEDIIYFGDSGRAPYGGRSYTELLSMALENVEFLNGFGVKLILAACGTISSSVFPELRERCSIPLFGVVESASQAAANSTKNGRIGVIATRVTIDSMAYQEAIGKLDPTIRVTAQACPKFVDLIEAGRCDYEDVEVRAAIAEYLSCIRDEKADTLLLGCTHYPLLSGAISHYMGKNVNLINSGVEAATALRGYIDEENMTAHLGRAGISKYYTSGDVELFKKYVYLLLGAPLDVEAAIKRDVTGKDFIRKQFDPLRQD